MAKRKTKKRNYSESDGTYFLKLVLYVIVGSQWVWFIDGVRQAFLPLPIGLFLGLAFATHEKFRVDRKIEFALLLVAALIGFWSQIGIFIDV